MAESSDNARDQDLEEIVAYLDGELAAEDCARVERQLASDEGFRQKLQSVERAWAALDELPLATVDDSFSRTTMQMAVEAAVAEVDEKTMAMPVLRRRSRLAAIASAAVAAAIGFLIFRLAWHDPNRMLVDDLPVIENVDIYSQFDSADFLRNLNREVGPQLQPAGNQPPSVAISGATLVEASGSPTERLRTLEEEQKVNLRGKLNRFGELSDREKQRLRDLHLEITVAKDRADLERTMQLYQAWLGGLPPATQFELRSLDSAARIRAIKTRIDQMRDDATLALTPDELKAFARGIRAAMEEEMRSAPPWQPRGDGSRDDRDRDDRGRGENDDQGERGGRDQRAGQNERGGRGGREDRGERGGRPGDPRGPGFNQLQRMFGGGEGPSAKFQDAIVAALPERTRATFAQLPPREKFEQFMTWKRQAYALTGNVQQQELEEFFAEELDPATREHLLSLPPAEMEQALKWRYRRHPEWGKDHPWFSGPHGERPDGGRWNAPGPGGPGDEGPPHGFGGRDKGRGGGPDDRRGPRRGGPGDNSPSDSRPDGPPPRGPEYGDRPGPPPE